MGICWFCHWGWPKAVADIYREALRKLDGNDYPLEFGPGHIVWSDENFDSAEWCLENFEENRKFCTYDDEELQIVRWSLEELAKLPIAMRSRPPDYDGEHPEKFPPSREMVDKDISKPRD